MAPKSSNNLINIDVIVVRKLTTCVMDTTMKISPRAAACTTLFENKLPSYSH